MLSSTETMQWLKLPKIFEHFAEHKLEDKNISFFEFLAIHYMHGSPKDKDYDKDMQLPFKTCCDCAAAVNTSYVPMEANFSFTKPVEIPEKKNYILQDQFPLSSYLAAIWQPPKSCWHLLILAA